MHRADGGRVTAAIPGTGGLARSGRHAVAGLLLAFAALLALPLQAQAQTTYVSNLNQTGTDTGLDAMHGQSFTTGDQAGGYQLGSVAVRMHYLAQGTTMTVSIYNTDTNGYPTTLKYALTAPSTIPYASTVYLSAPTGATLDAGTTYSVVFDVSATTFFYVTASDAEVWAASRSAARPRRRSQKRSPVQPPTGNRLRCSERQRRQMPGTRRG